MRKPFGCNQKDILAYNLCWVLRGVEERSDQDPEAFVQGDVRNISENKKNIYRTF
jgi:hypothetical protein